MDVHHRIKATHELKKADARLRVIIERVGPCTLEVPGERSSNVLFRSLARSIVAQQLSTKAANTIFGRVEALGGLSFPTPAQLLSLPHSSLRGAGLSDAKARYLVDLARRVDSKELDLEALAAREDHQIVTELVAVKGIGKWTAQMFLIFCLGRTDVFAPDDLGLRKGFQRVFALKEMPEKEAMEKVAAKWAPYRSVASWYLWRAVELPTDDEVEPAVSAKPKAQAKKAKRAKKTVGAKKKAAPKKTAPPKKKAKKS